MTSNNPAGRLLSILERGLELPENKNCRQAWCEILGVDQNDTHILMGRIGRVMALSTDIVESLHRIEGINVDRYLHWVKPLENAFAKNSLSGPWKEFRNNINVHVINYLTMTSDLLSHKSPESTISKSNLSSILNTARGLIDDVRTSDIPAEIREFMIRHLYKVCLAVEEYSITGAESISTAVESVFGHGVLHKDTVEISQSNSVAKKFWQGMANIALIVSISAGVQQLAPTVMELLPEIDFDSSANIADLGESDEELNK